MLKINELSKLYENNRGLRNLTLSAKSGTITGILGSNGSGKTTTFRLLLGLLQADSGTISYLDKEITNPEKLFGYVPEERSLMKDLRVEEHLIFLGKLKKLSIEELKYKINYWLDFFELNQYRRNRIIELSKGNQQKVQLVAALLHDPKIIILDEPLNGLDIYNITIFKRLLEHLKRQDKIILISSHQYHNIEEYCDYVLYLKDGNTLFSGELQKIKASKKERYVQILDKDYEYWKDNPEVIQIQKENKVLILKTNDTQGAKKIIKKVINEDIPEFSLKMPSLVQIIEEAQND